MEPYACSRASKKPSAAASLASSARSCATAVRDIPASGSGRHRRAAGNSRRLLPEGPVLRDASSAIDRHLQQRRPAALQRAPQRAGEPTERRAALAGNTEGSRRGDQIDLCGVSQARSNSGSFGDRQVLEDSAATVVDDDDTMSRPPAAASAVRSCCSVRSPTSATQGPSLAIPMAVDRLPSMPLAPRLPKKRSGLVATARKGVEVADRQRVAAEQAMAGRQRVEQRRDQRAFEVLPRTAAVGSERCDAPFGLREHRAPARRCRRSGAASQQSLADRQPDRPESACGSACCGSGQRLSALITICSAPLPARSQSCSVRVTGKPPKRSSHSGRSAPSGDGRRRKRRSARTAGCGRAHRNAGSTAARQESGSRAARPAR
jgi:hypothetical protein